MNKQANVLIRQVALLVVLKEAIVKRISRILQRLGGGVREEDLRQ